MKVIIEDIKLRRSVKGINILIFTIIFTVCLYFITINTVFKNRVLPGISFYGKDLSFLARGEVDTVMSEYATEKLPSVLGITVDGYRVEIPTSNLDVKLSSDPILNYGKGSNPLKVFYETVKLINGENLHPDYQFDIDPVIRRLPVTLDKNYAAQVHEGRVINCEKEMFFVHIDENELRTRIAEYFSQQGTVEMSLADISIFPDEGRIVKYCAEYISGKETIAHALNKLRYDKRIVFDDIFSMRVMSEDEVQWEINDKAYLKKILAAHKKNSELEIFDKGYEMHGKDLYLLRPPEEGGGLDVGRTIEAIDVWLLSPTEKLPYTYDSLDLALFSEDVNIIDFTKLIGSGKTRMKLYIDGERNLKVINAQAGIEEMHNRIVNPKEKFSFIKSLRLQPGGKTGTGRSFGGGVCNASTTLFRAVLESGLPIIERNGHTFYVDSYRWGSDQYEMNIVDAAVFADPEVDFVFKNNLSYPILLRIEIYTDENDYQYHIIHILTSGEAKDRRVEYGNWKRWNVRSDVLFFGSFERFVYEGDKKVLHDEFVNTYVDEPLD